MKIKTRLSLQFTFLVAVILLIFSILVYYFFDISQDNRFRDNLVRRARNTAVLLFDVKEIDSTLMRKIYRSTRSWEREEIIVIDSSLNVIYEHNREYLTPELVQANLGNTEKYFFTVKEKDCVLYRFNSGDRPIYVYVAAYNLTGELRLVNLRKILFFSILISIIISIYLSYLFSKNAVRPLTDIVNRIKRINIRILDERLDEGRKRDEIEQLAMTFNEMLGNLQTSFLNQEQFVSNASHELRTPLAVLISEADFFLNKDSSTEEYRGFIEKLSTDLKHLNTLLSCLLELARINKENILTKTDVRLDEVIYDAITLVKKRNPERKLIPRIQYTEDAEDITITGNYGLLEIAFKNLIDNACKFSNSDVFIEIESSNDTVTIRILDKGIGIPMSEMKDIYNPFKRSTNAKYIGGHGLGLSIVSQIIELHSGRISITSMENSGTCVSVTFSRFSRKTQS